MAVMEPNGEPEVLRVWSLLSEVSEQLSQNRSSAVNLHALADGAKAQAIHSQTGFVLRRFNLDKPKEAYDAELERMNAAMSAENQALLNDNRQLSALIREYEQTLENVMTTFRTRAHEVQQRELTLMRQCESILVQRESEALNEALCVNNARSESLARVGRLLRAVLRRLGGEDIQLYEAHTAHLHATGDGRSAGPSREPSKMGSHPEEPSEKTGAEAEGSGEGDKGKDDDDDNETHEPDESRPESPDQDQDVNRLLEEDEDPEKRLAAAEWALERECELARLERENEELRALVNGLLKPAAPSAAVAVTAASLSQRTPEPTSSTTPIPIPKHEYEHEHEHDHSSGEDEGEARSSDDHPSFSTFPRPQQRLLGGPPGTVGPFGTYKKNTLIRVDSR